MRRNQLGILKWLMALVLGMTLIYHEVNRRPYEGSFGRRRRYQSYSKLPLDVIDSTVTDPDVSLIQQQQFDKRKNARLEHSADNEDSSVNILNSSSTKNVLDNDTAHKTATDLMYKNADERSELLHLTKSLVTLRGEGISLVGMRNKKNRKRRHVSEYATRNTNYFGQSNNVYSRTLSNNWKPGQVRRKKSIREAMKIVA